MFGKHFLLLLALAVLGGCMAAEDQKAQKDQRYQRDQVARRTRTPGLLHLAHAGHPVGTYALAGPRAGGSEVGGGGGGPRVVVVGEPGAVHVSEHRPGAESLEEIDEELRQHYGRPAAPQGVRYVPNTSQRGLYHEARTLPSYTASAGGGHHTSVGLPLRYRLHQPQPGHGFTQATTFVGHPIPQPQQTPVAYALNQAQQAAAYRPGLASAGVRYPSAAPLAHTLASPVVRLPAHGVGAQGLGLGTQGVGLGYPQAAPVFIPLRAAQSPYNLQFGLSQSHPSVQTSYHGYGSGTGRSPAYSSEQSEDKPQYYQDSQERRPEYPKFPTNYPKTQERSPDHTEGQERDYYGSGERSQQAYSEYDKSYKFGSDESGAKAATTAYNSYHDDEDSSGEVSSAEKPSFKFFDHSGVNRGYAGGGDKGVATSYQSVTLETSHSSPRHPHYSHP